MTPIGDKLFDEFKNSLFHAPLLLAAGALFGATYAAFANLPVHQSAKAWAIWIVAENTLLNLGSALAKSHEKLMLIKATLFTLTSFLAIEEMRGRKLLGDRMMAVMIIIRSFIIVGLLTNAAVSARRNRLQAAQPVI